MQVFSGEKLNDVKTFIASAILPGGDESVFPKLASWCDSPEKNSYFGFETWSSGYMGFEWSAKELSKFGIKRENLVRVPF